MESISLLWPQGSPVGVIDTSVCADELQLVELAGLMFPGRSGKDAFEFSSKLVTKDVSVLNYRQACIGDILKDNVLAEAFGQAGHYMEEMRSAVSGIRENPEGFTSGGVMNGFKETVEKLERLFGTKTNMIEESDLDNYYAQLFRATIFSYRLSKAYVELLSLLRSSLDGASLQSEALCALREWVHTLCDLDRVDDSLKVLGEVEAIWKGVGGFSVDVLIDRSFHVIGMELSSVSASQYPRNGVVTARPGEDYSGIGSLSEFPVGGTTARFQECVITELGSALRPELLKLRNIVSKIPVSGVKLMLGLEAELSFYTGISKFLGSIKGSGRAVSCPGLSRTCFQNVKGAYPVSLMLIHGVDPVENDIYLPRGGNVNFVTGANSSGKTTWLVAAGQLQWLYQLGCWLPCGWAEMSPADGIFTLFASGESISGEDSRMGMEAIKLATIREQLTDNCMMLLNEPMTSTNAGEGIEICMDLLYDLMSSGVSAMMVSHYNEIYGMLKKRLSGTGLEDRLNSYVMEVEKCEDGIDYTYRLNQRKPDRSSHANEIVSRVGVTLSAMLHRLSDSGLDVHPEADVWNQLHPVEEEV